MRNGKPLDVLADALADGEDLFGVGAGQQHDKLLPAPAGREIAGPL